jgi:uncharacterized membrane protein
MAGDREPANARWSGPMLQIILTTALGGVAFLIPVVVVGLVVGKAVTFVRQMLEPVVVLLPQPWVDHAILTTIAAVAVLLGICFAAGLVARTEAAQRLVQRLEDRVLARIPFYTVLKTRAEAILSAEKIGTLKAVVVRLDDAWQLAFEVERVQDQHVAVFVPGSPDPWAGAVLVVEAERVSELDLSIPIVERLLHRLGQGTNEALTGALSGPGPSSP